MSNVGGMTNLCEDILASYDTREAAIRDIVVETSELLHGFREEHRERSNSLREALSSGEKARLEDFSALLEELRARVPERANEVAELLEGFHEQHQEMSGVLRQALHSGEQTRLEEYQATVGAIRQRLGEMGSEVRTLLDGFRTEREDMADAWRKLNAAMARRRGKAAGRASEVMRSAGPSAQRAGSEKRGQSLGQRVLAVIEHHPNGIKLTEVGRELGEKWQTLTGVTKGLLEEGVIEKRDSRYFPIGKF